MLRGRSQKKICGGGWRKEKSNRKLCGARTTRLEILAAGRDTVMLRVCRLQKWSVPCIHAIAIVLTAPVSADLALFAVVVPQATSGLK